MKKKAGLLFLLVFMLALVSCRQSGGDLLADNGIRYAILLDIYSPKVQDIFNPGDKVSIRWRVLSEMKKVDIFLYKKSDYILTITQSLSNKGEFIWTIPPDIEQSHHYKIKIVNDKDPSQYNFSEVFYILKY